jgi:hypothetical protein
MLLLAVTTASAQIETFHFLSLLVDPWFEEPHWAETIDQLELVENADHHRASGTPSISGSRPVSIFATPAISSS